MTKREIGENLFKEGYNCAQSVAAAFAADINMSQEDVLKISAPFGGGFGRLREVCGAVSGMMIVLGKLEGNSEADDQKKKEIYEKAQFLINKFKEENGSFICRELLNLDHKSDEPTPEKRTETYYKKRPCVEIVGIACDILEEYLGL